MSVFCLFLRRGLLLIKSTPTLYLLFEAHFTCNEIYDDIFARLLQSLSDGKLLQWNEL